MSTSLRHLLIAKVFLRLDCDVSRHTWLKKKKVYYDKKSIAFNNVITLQTIIKC